MAENKTKKTKTTRASKDKIDIRSNRLNQVIDADYCGRLTVREIAAIACYDKVNFPKGLDTPMCIGDFEGNFCTGVLSVSMGGIKSDHMCLMGDPHAHDM